MGRGSAGRAVLAAWLVSWACAPQLAAKTTWLQWGGPGRDFKSAASGLAVSWPAAGPPVLWSRELGPGYSAVLCDGEKLYTTYRRGDEEVLVALEASSGRTVWEYAYAAPPSDKQLLEFGRGPNATPLLAADTLYAIGFTGKLHAVEAGTGRLLWSHDLVQEYGAALLDYGYASSPLLYGGMLVALVGGERHAAIGFDLRDGTPRWRSAPLPIGYSSPLVIRVDGEDQLAFMTPSEVAAVGLTDGAVKWRRPLKNQYDVNCIGPWWREDHLLFVSSQGEAGSLTLRLTRREGATQVEEVARNPKVGFFHGTAVMLGDYIYGSHGPTLVALNVKTGEVAWQERGFPEASLLYADGSLIVLDEEGQLALASVSPQRLTVRSRFQLLGKRAWTVPTLTGTCLYVRGEGKILALQLGPSEPAAAGR